MTDSDPFAAQVRRCAVRISESGPAALSGLFDLTAHRLVRYASTVTRNQHDAEDAVQSALVKVSEQPQIITAAGSPWSYLLRMVRNECLLILRRKQRWHLLGNLSDLLTRRGVDEVEQEEMHRVIWAALRTLPIEQSEVVVLKIWEDLTFAQIGEILEVSPSTVASRYRYAIEKLAHQVHREDREVRL